MVCLAAACYLVLLHKYQKQGPQTPPAAAAAAAAAAAVVIAVPHHL
jgi:hypothetical protein